MKRQRGAVKQPYSAGVCEQVFGATSGVTPSRSGLLRGGCSPVAFPGGFSLLAWPPPHRASHRYAVPGSEPARTRGSALRSDLEAVVPLTLSCSGSRSRSGGSGPRGPGELHGFDVGGAQLPGPPESAGISPCGTTRHQINKHRFMCHALPVAVPSESLPRPLQLTVSGHGPSRCGPFKFTVSP